MTDHRRVVVTGIGAVSPLGNNAADSWNALLQGRSGIGKITGFDATGYRCQIGGEIKNLDVSPYIDVKEARHMDFFCQLAIVATDEAVQQSGFLQAANFNPERCGVMVSSGTGGLSTMQKQCEVLKESGPGRIGPMAIPMFLADMVPGHLSIRYNLKGPNFSLLSACATGLHSIGEASWMIKRGDADVMICGGTETSVTPIGMAAFGSMRALASQFNDDPEHASRPFDADRCGFVPGDGAGILVIEEEQHARQRGAVILAEIKGYGLSADAHHITAPTPDGEGAIRAIKQAIQTAQVPLDDIQYVNAHGTSTHLNDAMETAALKTVFGEQAYKLAVSSTKSMTGHMLGAAGGFESVVCVKAIQDGIVPGTMNYTTPDPECDLDYVPNAARKIPLRNVLKCNYGFGGHNAAILYSKYE